MVHILMKGAINLASVLQLGSYNGNFFFIMANSISGLGFSLEVNAVLYFNL